MKSKSSPEESLAGHLDTFFLRLMEEAYPASAPPEDDAAGRVGFVDRVRLFDSGVRWVATKHRVNPEEEEDAFAAARRRAISGKGGRGAAGSSAANGAG